MATRTQSVSTATAKWHGGFLDRQFKLVMRGSTPWREFRGGSTTFLTMAYILVLNALIMGTVKDGSGQFLGGGTSPNLVAVSSATALVACIMTFLMGVGANFPLAMATGLGLNAYVTFSVAPTMTWPEAMGLIVIEGIIMLVLVLSGIRQKILNAVPKFFKLGIAAAIGMFLIYIGLADAGVIRAGAGTLTTLGIGGELHGTPLVVFFVVLAAMVALRRFRGGILLCILGGTILAIVLEKVYDIGSRTDATGQVVNPTAWSLNVPDWPDKWFDMPDFSTVFHISFGAFGDVGWAKCLVIIGTMLLSNLFDTVGTMTAIGSEAGLLDRDGNPERSQSILVVDSIGVGLGGAFGVSSSTAYIESGAGVAAGARTGLASVVTAGWFFVAMFMVSVVKVIPYEAATPALVFVGFLMIEQLLKEGPFYLDEVIPVVTTIVFVMLGYSIATGIGFGFIIFALVAATGDRFQRRQLNPVMLVLALVFGVFFLLPQIEGVLGIS